MEKIILDYSDYITDRQIYKTVNKSGNVTNVVRQSQKGLNFFEKQWVCPFCEGELQEVYRKEIESIQPIDTRGYQSVEIVNECSYCDWWEFKITHGHNFDLFGNFEWHNGGDEITEENIKYGIVKKFNASDKELPISVLNSAIQRDKSILYKINPTKFEMFVQSVLSDFFKCEVKHVGKSNDGGIDLVVINSDNPILVQVKRRENEHFTEKVEVIREFIGALYLADSRNGIVVSTAKKFSKNAKRIEESLLKERKLDIFTLIDFGKLCSILNLAKPKIEKPWKKFTTL